MGKWLDFMRMHLKNLTAVSNLLNSVDFIEISTYQENFQIKNDTIIISQKVTLFTTVCAL